MVEFGNSKQGKSGRREGSGADNFLNGSPLKIRALYSLDGDQFFQNEEHHNLVLTIGACETQSEWVAAKGNGSPVSHCALLSLRWCAHSSLRSFTKSHGLNWRVLWSTATRVHFWEFFVYLLNFVVVCNWWTFCKNDNNSWFLLACFSHEQSRKFGTQWSNAVRRSINTVQHSSIWRLVDIFI